MIFRLWRLHSSILTMWIRWRKRIWIWSAIFWLWRQRFWILNPGCCFRQKLSRRRGRRIPGQSWFPVFWSISSIRWWLRSFWIWRKMPADCFLKSLRFPKRWQSMRHRWIWMNCWTDWLWQSCSVFSSLSWSGSRIRWIRSEASLER